MGSRILPPVLQSPKQHNLQHPRPHRPKSPWCFQPRRLSRLARAHRRHIHATVCDGSSLIEFNYDYENNHRTSQIPPCFCGINGAETANFMKAIGLDAKDQARRCFNYWTATGTGNWPAGVDSVSYGDGKGTSVSKKAVDDCRKHSGASDPDYCNVG